MQILLCAATGFEIEPTADWIRARGIPGIEILVTGVGLMAATYQISRAVHARRPQLLLQAGVAGSFDVHRPLGDVVAVRSETLGDLGVQENGSFRSLFDMQLADPARFPWSGGRLVNLSPLLEESGLPVTDSVTIHEVSTRAERIAYYREELGAGIESMEGAALHYVGLMENLPFLQLRSLSNFVGERDKTRWQMRQAITRLNEALQTLLSKYTES